MPKRKVNGIEIYYETHGEGDLLVLIMGLRRNAEWWYRQIPALSKHFEVLVFDNRGAGRTDKPKMDYSIRLFADDTAGLMEALGIREAYILGVSMGGYIAQELALNYPNRVKRLILGCTGPGGEKAVLASPERLKKFTANEGLSPEEILKKDMDIYFSGEYIKENQEKIEEFVEISLRYYQPLDAFERQFAACLKHDTVNRLSRIDVPTLIMSGDDDPLVPPENSKILNALIPRSESVFFPGKRHCFFIEEADQFNQMVTGFFQLKS
jgi:pimeloyl-ACP methyl ester carboxylesterase